MIILECEVCGASGAEKVAKIGESKLVVCEKCASLGEEIKNPKKEKRKVKKKKKSKSYTPINREKVLKRRYGKILKNARENKELTMEELAQRLGEKESVIRRIENEKLKPDTELTKTLKKELDIELFTETGKNYKNKSKESPENLTIGDVAEVK